MSSVDPEVAVIVYQFFDGRPTGTALSALLEKLRRLRDEGRLVASTALVRALLERWPYYRGHLPSGGGTVRDPALGVLDLLRKMPGLNPSHLVTIAEKCNSDGASSDFIEWLCSHPASAPEALKVLARGPASYGTRAQEQLSRWQESQNRREQAERDAKDTGRLAAAEGDEVAAALAAYEEGEVDIEELLERCGVGPTTDDGLVGGGTCAGSLSDFPKSGSADFDADLIADQLDEERYEALMNGEDPTPAEEELYLEALTEDEFASGDAPQFDVWEITPAVGAKRYAISWRDSDGHATTFDGLWDSVAQVMEAVRSRFRKVEAWFD